MFPYFEYGDQLPFPSTSPHLKCLCKVYNIAEIRPSDKPIGFKRPFRLVPLKQKLDAIRVG
jgi:hypothetical protein